LRQAPLELVRLFSQELVPVFGLPVPVLLRASVLPEPELVQVVEQPVLVVEQPVLVVEQPVLVVEQLARALQASSLCLAPPVWVELKRPRRGTRRSSTV
jgi:hypothetical protein